VLIKRGWLTDEARGHVESRCQPAVPERRAHAGWTANGIQRPRSVASRGRRTKPLGIGPRF
jgi:hypothetical protein